MGRDSITKHLRITQKTIKIQMDERMDGQTDGPTEQRTESSVRDLENAQQNPAVLPLYV